MFENSRHMSEQLDRHITGNYGEDQFPNQDAWDSASERVEDNDIEEACEGYRKDCPKAKWAICGVCHGLGYDEMTGCDCNSCVGDGSMFVGCEAGVVNAEGKVIGDVADCETWEQLVESKMQDRREAEADRDVDR